MLSILFAAVMAVAAPAQQAAPANPHADHAQHGQAGHAHHQGMKHGSHDMACCKDKAASADCCKGKQADCCAGKVKADQGQAGTAAHQHDH